MACCFRRSTWCGYSRTEVNVSVHSRFQRRRPVARSSSHTTDPPLRVALATTQSDLSSMSALVPMMPTPPSPSEKLYSLLGWISILRVNTFLLSPTRTSFLASVCWQVPHRYRSHLDDLELRSPHCCRQKL